MRYLLYPIIFLRQEDRKLIVRANGLSSGYEEIHYCKDGINIDHKIALTDMEIMIDDFPDGPGVYKFYLASGDKKTMPIDIYISDDDASQLLHRILSYIAYPEDIDYMTSEINQISFPSSQTYTQKLMSNYRRKKDIQPFERKAMCQIIDMAERYENIAAMTMNKNSASCISIRQSPLFSISATKSISGNVDVYKKDNIARLYMGTFPLNLSTSFVLEAVPDAYYEMDVFIDGEFAIRFIHYQPDEDGAAYLWEQKISNLASIERSMSNDVQLSESGIVFSDEEKERLLLERVRENNNALIGQVRPWRNINRDAILHIEIPDYKLLEAMGKDFYLSVREPDQFLDTAIDKRYLISGERLSIDTARDCLYDDMIFYVEDEERNIVSSFVWYTMEDENERLEEYTEKQRQLRAYEYTSGLIKMYAQRFGRGESYQQFSNVVTSLSQDMYDSEDELFLNIVYDIVRNPSYYGRDIDNVVAMTAVSHMSRPYCNLHFFKKGQCPTFYYARDSIVFPGIKDRYVLVILKSTSDKDGTPVIKKEYVVPEANSSYSVNIANDDICMMYAIDIETYNRSGFIIFNNIGSRVYYKNNIEMGVVVGG